MFNIHMDPGSLHSIDIFNVSLLLLRALAPLSLTPHRALCALRACLTRLYLRALRAFFSHPTHVI